MLLCDGNSHDGDSYDGNSHDGDSYDGNSHDHSDTSLLFFWNPINKNEQVPSPGKKRAITCNESLFSCNQIISNTNILTQTNIEHVLLCDGNSHDHSDAFLLLQNLHILCRSNFKQILNMCYCVTATATTATATTATATTATATTATATTTVTHLYYFSEIGSTKMSKFPRQPKREQ